MSSVHTGGPPFIITGKAGQPGSRPPAAAMSGFAFTEKLAAANR